MTATEQSLERVARDLQTNLPKGKMPFLMKVVALLLLVGGLGISGSVLTDFISTEEIGFGYYITRLIVGFVMILIAYGLFRRRRWSLWLYALVIIVGLFVNLMLTLFPLAIFIYLYVHRKYLKTTLVEKALVDLFVQIGKAFGIIKRELTK